MWFYHNFPLPETKWSHLWDASELLWYCHNADVNFSYQFLTFSLQRFFEFTEHNAADSSQNHPIVTWHQEVYFLQML